MTAINFTILQDEVESGEKCQTIRKAKCIFEKAMYCRKYGGGCNYIRMGMDFEDVICSGYEYRIKPGDTLQLYAGAKLLREATCTESFPIKFEDLTEEIAWADGFKNLAELRRFLIKTYDAKDGDVFQIIRWKKWQK